MNFSNHFLCAAIFVGDSTLRKLTGENGTSSATIVSPAPIVQKVMSDTIERLKQTKGETQVFVAHIEIDCWGAIRC